MKILVELPRSKILGKESFCAHEVSEVLKTTGNYVAARTPARVAPTRSGASFDCSLQLQLLGDASSQLQLEGTVVIGFQMRFAWDRNHSRTKQSCSRLFLGVVGSVGSLSASRAWLASRVAVAGGGPALAAGREQRR
jgi:hypothetical protein